MREKFLIFLLGKVFIKNKKFFFDFFKRRSDLEIVITNSKKRVLKSALLNCLDLLIVENDLKLRNLLEHIREINNTFGILLFGEIRENDAIIQNYDDFVYFKDFEREEIVLSKIERTLKKYGRVRNEEGVLITHGTDTLSWALAYLRYSLKDLKGNVAVTGSQIPLEGTFSPSDAIGNLRTAVYLLTYLKPPHLFAVFNNGKDIFSGRLTKLKKWDVEAFEGRLAAKVTHEGVKILRDDWVLIPYEDLRLKRIYLIKTGGTIESKVDKKGALIPRGDFVTDFIKENLSKYFENLIEINLFALDSSNISFEEWEKLVKKIESLNFCKCDTKFEKGVKPIFVNPLYTSEDYRKLFQMCKKGAILLGYGAGNANVLKKSLRSISIPLKKAVKEGLIVAVTSQIPLELYDVEYESGRKLIEYGGIPCGDLSFSDAQVKLSYILGHDDLIKDVSAQEKIDYETLIISFFLSGVNMTKNQKDELYKRLRREKKMKPIFLPKDPFVANHFDKAIETVVRKLKE